MPDTASDMIFVPCLDDELVLELYSDTYALST